MYVVSQNHVNCQATRARNVVVQSNQTSNQIALQKLSEFTVHTAWSPTSWTYTAWSFWAGDQKFRTKSRIYWSFLLSL